MLPYFGFRIGRKSSSGWWKTWSCRGCELVANVVGCLNLSPKKTAWNWFCPYTSFHSSEPTLAGVVAGSDSITSANLRAAFPSACNKRSQKPLFDRLRPVSAIWWTNECPIGAVSGPYFLVRLKGGVFPESPIYSKELWSPSLLVTLPIHWAIFSFLKVLFLTW